MAKDCRASSKFPPPKKRTINALPWCSAAVNKINSMQSPVKSVIKVRQRIVYSNVCTHSCSANWRADWAMYVGKTYAQVLKSKPRNQNQNSINQVKDQHSFTKPSGLSKHQCQQVHDNFDSSPDCPPTTNHVKNVKIVNHKVIHRLNSEDMTCKLTLKNHFLPISPEQEKHDVGNDHMGNTEIKIKENNVVKCENSQKSQSKKTKVFNKGVKRWEPNIVNTKANHQATSYQKNP